MRRQFYDHYKIFLDLLLKIHLPFFNKLYLSKFYDKNYYYDTQAIKALSAVDVVNIISNNIKFKSVFDIGCGEGIYLNNLHKLGKEVLGCDVSKDALKLSPKEFTIFQADITKPIFLNRKYDLIICFEVAEHIGKQYSMRLINNCIENGKIILFSAASIGQGGVGHINEQSHDFWINLFNRLTK